MKVAIDTTALLLSKGGVHVYLRELLAALSQNKSGIDIDLIQYKLKSDRKNRIRAKLDTVYRDTVWQNLILPKEIMRTDADVFHAPHWRTTFRAGLPYVVTVYDLYGYRNPKGFTKWAAFSRHFFPIILKNASVILVISEFTRQELLRLMPSLDASKIIISHLGVSERFKSVSGDISQLVRDKYSLPEKFILAVNTLEPRKNLPRFLDAFRAMQDKMEEHLVLVGSPGWINKHVDSIHETMRKNEKVHYLGFVPDEDLTALYSLATAYVFPSYYEGFGLPALEAMACGCPVIASKGSSLDEVINGAGIQFDPYSKNDMVEAVLRVVGSELLCDELKLHGIENAKKFNWHKTAERTIFAYQQAVI